MRSWCGGGGGGVVPLKVKLENYMYGKQLDQIDSTNVHIYEIERFIHLQQSPIQIPLILRHWLTLVHSFACNTSTLLPISHLMF